MNGKGVKSCVVRLFSRQQSKCFFKALYAAITKEEIAEKIGLSKLISE